MTHSADQDSHEPKPLSGKRCLVTGGGSGIGSAISIALARAGCHVAIAGRRKDALEDTRRRFVGRPAILSHTADVGDPKSVEELFHWVAEQLGSIDLLVNAAGVNVTRRGMAELDPADWDAMLRINASGVYHCMRAVLPQMRARGDGLIVNIGSVAGIRASVLGGAGYSASKFAMTGLSLTVGREEARHGIRVTTIHPGEVETPMLDKRPVAVTPEQRTKVLQPEDVAAAVMMVACLPARAHVTELVIKPTAHDFA